MVSVIDGDFDRPQNLVFSLSGEGIDIENPHNSHFEIKSSTGEVFVRKKLDRDRPGGRPSWGLTVFAQDEGGTGLVGYSEIVVHLNDINDNAPLFSQTVYYGNITENGGYKEKVMTINAEDHDDPNEGTNAQLTYSIEQNVIDERTAQPIFMIEPETGVIRTAVCCLDREETKDYLIQVVAMDGGGLKGTGTASILVLDINDRPPRFTKDEWTVEIEESEGSAIPDYPILTVSVHDDDEYNTFSYRVLNSSGFGADKFKMETNADGTGSLWVIQPLDYEDPDQAEGFEFQIQVSDRTNGISDDNYYTAKSWVKVKLVDINDNVPQFFMLNSEVRVFENTPVGRNLTTIIAKDPDMSGRSKISYMIDRRSDKERKFLIDNSGTVSLQRTLDREVNPHHIIKILASDDGIPAKTATAALTIFVMDINDNPPRLMENSSLVLPENKPPGKIADVLASDLDDPLKNHGPPFLFALDSLASEEVQNSFQVVNIPEGANGDGVAGIFSLREFDREEQREFCIPIVIKDSGTPSMVGTSTLTVVIGDVNDNVMLPGTKEVLFYSYKGRAHQTQVGRVYVHDPDDWDLSDKKFTWATRPHPNFHLNEEDGMITMKYATSETSYHVEFFVHDHKHSQFNIRSSAEIQVRHISEKAIRNSGSVRIENISDIEFVRKWDYRTDKPIRSKADQFRESVAKVMGVEVSSVDLFSIKLKQTRPPVVDLYFSVYDSYYFEATRLNGLVQKHKFEIEAEIGLSIIMVGIDACLYENANCDGSCTSELKIFDRHYLIDANRTSFVGVNIEMIPECVCGANNFSIKESCRPNPCYNGGSCIEEKYGVHCECLEEYDGPICQMLTRTFSGNGFAWFPPLQSCERSHLSVEFLTLELEGLIVYNGPLTPPGVSSSLVTDFIALELHNGRIKLFINFGSGTLQMNISTSESLSDGRWHTADVYWDKETVSIDVDRCRELYTNEEGESSIEGYNDLSQCHAEGTLPLFDEYLNVNSPLQLGGLEHPLFPLNWHESQNVPKGEPFQGCIRNLMMNGHIYDLAQPALYRNTEVGCSQFERLCVSNSSLAGCGPNGVCSGFISEPFCECKSGWTGPSCSEPTVPSYFDAQSYVKYDLSFKLNPYRTYIQLRFRTWEGNGELFRVADKLNREYGILEIRRRHLRFRYNLNAVTHEENELWLSAVIVNDGRWHAVTVERYGPIVFLVLDGGEGRRYNETSSSPNHLFMNVDVQEGVSSGGRVEYSSENTFVVSNDYKRGCIDDIRIEGKPLPLPPSQSVTQWAQSTMFHNVASQCISQNQCLNITCVAPLICKDLWMRHECGCPDGTELSKDHRVCLDEDECLSGPCKNGGVCHNQKPSYICHCPHGYIGNNCEVLQEAGSMQPSLPALAALIVCILIAFVLILALMLFLRRKRHHRSNEDADKLKQEAEVKYEKKRGGEGEVTILDLTAMSTPVVSVVANGGNNISRLKVDEIVNDGGISNVDVVVCRHDWNKSRCHVKEGSRDDLRNYAYEGGGGGGGSSSTPNSLSSLGDRQQRTEFQ